jgi:uncharacterized protein YggT (Ycf19 family)
MIDSNTATEEVTTVQNQSPQQVIKKTVRAAQPQAKGDAPQQVYDKKKTIFRFNQVIWYILGLIEVLLTFRVVLKALGANQNVGFTNFIYSLTEPIAAPFYGILRTTNTGVSTIEWSTIIAAIVYLCIAWGLVYLLDLFFPITPNDVGTE